MPVVFLHFFSPKQVKLTRYRAYIGPIWSCLKVICLTLDRAREAVSLLHVWLNTSQILISVRSNWYWSSHEAVGLLASKHFPKCWTCASWFYLVQGVEMYWLSPSVVRKQTSKNDLFVQWAALIISGQTSRSFKEFSPVITWLRNSIIWNLIKTNSSNQKRSHYWCTWMQFNWVAHKNLTSPSIHLFQTKIT